MDGCNSPFSLETDPEDSGLIAAHFSCIGPYYRISPDLHGLLSETYEYLKSSLLDSFMEVPVYVKDKPLALWLRLTTQHQLVLSVKPSVEVLNPLQQLIRMLGNFVLCPKSHLNRFGEVPGTGSPDPSLLGLLARLLVNSRIHECASVQPDRPLRCDSCPFRFPQYTLPLFFEDMILIIVC
jgi:hypothetical protein